MAIISRSYESGSSFDDSDGKRNQSHLSIISCKVFSWAEICCLQEPWNILHIFINLLSPSCWMDRSIVINCHQTGNNWTQITPTKKPQNHFNIGGGSTVQAFPFNFSPVCIPAGFCHAQKSQSQAILSQVHLSRIRLFVDMKHGPESSVSVNVPHRL